jgi:Carbohydrate binding module (family 6)
VAGDAQGATLITLGLRRPLTGRNALVEIEGEDYDGQSGATKEDSNDTSLGQSISVTGNGYVYFENVDYTDGGVASVQLRVKAQAAATVELHAESPTGALLGRCMVPSTSNAWASQACTLDQTATGMARLYVVFGGAMHLNWLKFAAGTVSPTGTGGAGGGAGGASGGAAGGMGGGTTGGRGGTAAGGGGGSATGGAGAGTTGGAGAGTTGGAGAGTTGGAGAGTTGGVAGNASGGSASGDNSGSGGTPPIAGGGNASGCSCHVGDARAPSATLLFAGLAALVSGLRRNRARR